MGEIIPDLLGLHFDVRHPGVIESRRPSAGESANVYAIKHRHGGPGFAPIGSFAVGCTLRHRMRRLLHRAAEEADNNSAYEFQSVASTVPLDCHCRTRPRI